MKKIISLLLCIIMLVCCPVSVYAYTFTHDPLVETWDTMKEWMMGSKESAQMWCKMYSYFRPGDVNADGFITAADARICLRHVAKVEEMPDDIYYYAAHVYKSDSGRYVSAADARMMLREAAKIEKIPERVIKTNIKNGFGTGRLKYYEESEYRWSCEVEDDAMDIEYAIFTKDEVYYNETGACYIYYILTPKKTGTFTVTLTYGNDNEVIEQFNMIATITD